MIFRYPYVVHVLKCVIRKYIRKWRIWTLVTYTSALSVHTHLISLYTPAPPLYTPAHPLHTPSTPHLSLHTPSISYPPLSYTSTHLPHTHSSKHTYFLHTYVLSPLCILSYLKSVPKLKSSIFPSKWLQNGRHN